MKVLLINGSPRPGGNSDFVQDMMSQFGLSQEIETKSIKLREYNISPCCGCELCHKTGDCSAKDDFLGTISALILEAAAMVVITPVYQGGVTGITKNFIDRCEMFRKGRLLRGKLCGGVAIGGYPGGGQELTLMQIQYFAHICAMRYVASWGKERSHLGGHCIAYSKREVEKDRDGLRSAKNVMVELLDLLNSLEKTKMKQGGQDENS